MKGVIFGDGKRCNGCKTWVEAAGFHKDAANKDGLSTYCKPCEKLYKAVRRTQIKDDGGVVTDQQWEDLKAKHDYMCLRCLRQEPEIVLSMDHVIPISKGGRNVIENIQPLCLACNDKKGTGVVDYRRLITG